jgi:transcriptional regulator with XRE-family HTH domain
MSTPAAATELGLLLRQWRASRRWSQLDLALEADVSTRHLSYVETGKSQPSRELIERLAEAMQMPLRERNHLLRAAGYADHYRETPIDAPELQRIQRAVDFILAQQEPYPAFVLNRYWDILQANAAAQRVNGFLLGGRSSPHANMLRHVFDPQDLRAVLVNWEEVAADLLHHLRQSVSTRPDDARARALLDEMLAAPDVPAGWRKPAHDSGPSPLLTTCFAREGVTLRFFSSITVFATPRDVTLEELRIECCFPLDQATADFCRALAERG